MNKQKFTLVARVLGEEELPLTKSKLIGGKEGAFLATDQLQKIEDSLTAANTDREDFKNQMSGLANDSAQLSDIEKALATARTDFDIEADTAVATIAALTTKITELNGAPAKPATTQHAEGDPVEDTNKSYLESTSLFDKLTNN